MRGPSTPPSGPFFWTKLRLNAHGWPRLPWNRAWRADLSAYADDELDPSERARVQAQLEASPERQQWLAEVEHVQETLAALSAAELPRSFELSELQFAAARTADSEPVDERAAATRAIPLRLATAGAVASLVALATVSGFDMLDNPTVSTPTITRIEPTATAVTTGVASQSTQSAAESPAAPAGASESEPAQAQQAATIAAAPSDDAEQPATTAQSQQPEPAATEAALEEAEAEEQAEQAAQEQAQYQQQAAQQAEQQIAQDTPPAMTAEQQEAARDPARGAVNAGISADQSQSAAADPTFSARDDSDAQAAQTEQADAAISGAASDQAQTQAAEPAPESQSVQVAETDTEDQPAATSETSPEADQPDDPQPSRVVVVSTSDQADQDTRRISIPDTQQQIVHRNSDRSADPDDWPIPARPQAAGETSAAEPGWETPVQIALAIVAIVALLIWVFCWLLTRRQTV